MNKGKYVFSQVFEFISRYDFDKCVERFHGNKYVRDFTCWQQFLAMSFGQLTHRESLRSIIVCLNAKREKFYHLGFNTEIARATLARANEKRDYRIYEDFAQTLITEARRLYVDDNEFDLELTNAAYALDSSTIDLCLNAFRWAKYKRRKGAIKMHTLLDLKGEIPTFIKISNGKYHDVNVLDEIEFEREAFYVMDKAYIDFARFDTIHLAGAFFITRAKSNFSYKRLYSRKIDKSIGIRCDQIIKLTGTKSSKRYPHKLRRIKYYDKEDKKHYVFITNNFVIDAKLIADLYKHCWKIEIFFRWIKQHLRIKVFWGRSENAVKTQIWIAVCIYALVAIIRKKLKIKKSMYEILQILSISLFEKTPIESLFSSFDYKNHFPMSENRPTLPGI